MMDVDLALIERWLSGWSLARGLPRPRLDCGGLVVDVGWPDQLRRHVFVDAGSALQECAAGIQAPFIYLKAAVDSDDLRRALPARWHIESQRYLMHCPTPMASAAMPAGYVADVTLEHGASVVRLATAGGETAATGRVVLLGNTAVFDRIETSEVHRRKGLATALMGALDVLAQRAEVSERLLVATEAGRALYRRLGWRELAPYSTAVLPA